MGGARAWRVAAVGIAGTLLVASSAASAAAQGPPIYGPRSGASYPTPWGEMAVSGQTQACVEVLSGVGAYGGWAPPWAGPGPWWSPSVLAPAPSPWGWPSYQESTVCAWQPR